MLGHYLVITNNYILCPSPGCSLQSGLDSWEGAEEESYFTEFLWFSEFSCHQAAVSLQRRRDQFLSASLSHCTLFIFTGFLFTEIFDTNDILWPDDTSPLSGLCDHVQMRRQVIITQGHISLDPNTFYWPGVICVTASAIYCRFRTFERSFSFRFECFLRIALPFLLSLSLHL